MSVSAVGRLPLFRSGDTRRIPNSVVAISAAMGLTLTMISMLRHGVFLSKTFDLAFYVQDVWAIANGVWTNTVSGFHVFADHFSPVLILLAPLANVPTAYSLLVIQSAVVALGVLPAYRLGSSHAGHRHGLVVAICYAASAAIWHAVVFDFHPVTLGVPLLMWLIAEVETGRSRFPLFLMGLAAVLIREDISILAGVILLHGAVRRRDRYLAGGAALVSAVGIGYMMWATLSAGGMGGYHLWTRFQDPGSNPIGGVLEIASNIMRPDSLVSLTVVLLPLLILPPLRSWRVSWPGLAIVIFNCVVPYKAQASLYYQYFAPAVPFLVWGASRALSQITTRKQDRTRLALVATVSTFAFFAPLVHLGYGLPDRFLSTSLSSLERGDLGSLLSVIPSDASVSATDFLLPHLADRRYAYPFPGPMECSQSLIFHVERTFFTEYVAVEWDAFGPGTDLRGMLTSWGYKPVIEDATAGVWVLAEASPASQPCPSVAEEREEFTKPDSVRFR